MSRGDVLPNRSPQQQAGSLDWSDQWLNWRFRIDFRLLGPPVPFLSHLSNAERCSPRGRLKFGQACERYEPLVGARQRALQRTNG